MSLIIFSKIRKAILTLLFLNEDKEFYVREIARLIHFSSSGVQKELAHLEKEEILISKIRGRLKLFQVNKNDPSYLELKNIIIKSTGLKFYLEKILCNFPNIKIAFIYGSWAKGEADSLSDIDLLLIGDAKYDKLNEEIVKFEDIIGREINFQLINKKEFKVRKKRKDTFIMDLLENPKVFIIGGISEL